MVTKLDAQAPLLELRRSIPAHQPGQANFNPFVTTVVADFPGGTMSGSAHFDEDAQFPYYALFLNQTNTLILRLKQKTKTYTKIGVAIFMRSSKGEMLNLLTPEPGVGPRWAANVNQIFGHGSDTVVIIE